MMGEKKHRISVSGFLIALFVTCGIFAAAGAVAVYAVDPFFHYHAPYFGLSRVQTQKEYQVPGALRNFDYDAVIAGSSVVENNDNSWFDTAFGVHTVKAVRSYGGIADLCWYMDLAFDTHALKMVFFNLDPAAMIAEPETTFEATGCPMYLYDDNPFNDINYLLNSTVLFEDIPYMVAQSMAGYNENLSYNWAEGKNFSKEGALSQYYRKKDVTKMLKEDSRKEQVEGNIALLLDLVEDHPETEFYFFIPPYSALWWDNAERNGLTDVYLWSKEQVMEALLSCENVRLWDFQVMEDVVGDLDNYMDTVHFTPKINQRMCGYLQDGTYEVTLDTCEKTLTQTRKMVNKLLENLIKDLEEEDAFLYEN